jgi:hypothetical protein
MLLTLWFSWTRPFDGGGRASVPITQAIFNFKLFQACVNPFDQDSFYVRSTQDGHDWDLWQKAGTLFQFQWLWNLFGNNSFG